MELEEYERNVNYGVGSANATIIPIGQSGARTLFSIENLVCREGVLAAQRWNIFYVY